MKNAQQPFRQPSNLVSRFSMIPQANIPRSAFDLSHGYKTGFEAGYLIPFDLYEVLPGDTFKVDPTIFCRLTTQLVPFMDNLYLDTFYFFVPNRLVWTNWQKFCGERTPDPTSSISFTVPVVTTANLGHTQVGTLHNYLGVRTIRNVISFNALPSRGYTRIWNDWFRDENIQSIETQNTGDGPDGGAASVLKRRNKRHDYFTSCLPWPQKGSTAVTLPLGTRANVLGLGVANTTFGTVSQAVNESDGTGSTYANAKQVDPGSPNTQLYVEEGITGISGTNDYPNIWADLSTATAATINSIREAFQVQKLLERDARSGTRYVEILKAHFGVISEDARLQRPEFLGGNSTPLYQTPTAQTTFQGTETRLDAKGALASNGSFVSRGGGFTKSFTEHGYIMGLMMVRADLTYQQGMDRHWFRSTRYDYYWPAFAHLGEQTVYNREIFIDATAGNDTIIFGYQERWAEYKYQRSLITGKLQSDETTPLDYWHLAQDFSAAPTLSTTFIEENPPISRVTGINANSASEPPFMADCYIKTRAVRPIPAYSVPGLVDHF